MASRDDRLLVAEALIADLGFAIESASDLYIDPLELLSFCRGNDDATLTAAVYDVAPSPSTVAAAPSLPSLETCPFEAAEIDEAFSWVGFESAPPIVDGDGCEYENASSNAGSGLSPFRLTVAIHSYGESLGYHSISESASDYSFTPTTRAGGFAEACQITQNFAETSVDPAGNRLLAHCDSSTAGDSVSFPQYGLVYVFMDSGVYEIGLSPVAVTSDSLSASQYPEVSQTTDSFRALALSLTT